MKKQVGLWIDHKEAYVVFFQDGVEEAKDMASGMEKHIRFSEGPRAEKGIAEDHRDRQFTAHLNKYYDEVVATIHEAEAILILGPGEAKGELKKRLEHKGLGARIVGVETEDKMTHPQIAAKVRQYFKQ